jgi:predicted RNA-binding protein YlxR (DUF448 family)
MHPDPKIQNDGALTETDGVDETDAGPAKAGSRAGGKGVSASPERRCIATMERHPQAAMIRFVRSPEGEAVPDLAARLPGRGAWILATREAVDLAVKRQAFSRAFRAPTSVPAELAARIEAMLAKRVLDGLGLAKRAGDLLAGYDQVRDAVRSGGAAVLIEASDGAEDGRAKVLGLAKAVYGPDDAESGVKPGAKPAWPVLAGCFTSDELGMALGRDRVIHACLKRGRLTQAWVGELVRLSGFRPLAPRDWRSFERPSRVEEPGERPPDGAPDVN